VSDVGAVVRPLNRPRLDEQQIVVGRIDVGPLKRLNRPRSNGLQTVVVQGGVEVVCITLGNYHVEPRLWLDMIMRPIVTCGVAWSVSLSVCLSVTVVNPAKTAEPIEMPFGSWDRVGSRNHVGLLDEGQTAPYEGTNLRGNDMLGHARRHCRDVCKNG